MHQLMFDVKALANKEEEWESPDNTSRYCSGKVIAPPSCKQSSRVRGGKN